MAMNIEKIKDLLKKAIKTGDEELISIASSLLDDVESVNKTQQQEKNIPPSKKQSLSQRDFLNDNFLTPIKNNKQDQSQNNRIAVNLTKKFNTFVDDRTDSVGEEYKTPDVKPTERKRPPPQKIDQTCTRCNKTYKVLPVHKRDFYVCDKCLGSMAR